MTEKKSQAKVFSINCTSCGAPINLFGGHRVQSIICASCGACLDAREEYKVVDKFINMKKRPNLPIKIGMSGKFKGVEFTIIGLVKWVEKDGLTSYTTYDFQLYSPTHGYAWLRRENGHYTFIHEVKDIPDRNISFSTVSGTKFKVRDRTFSVIENGLESIDYVEGELTWVAKLGDKSRYLSCASPPFLFEISEMNGERDFAFGEYLEPQEVYKAFGLKGKPLRPIGIYFCQEYKPNSFVRISFHAIWFAVISLIIALAIMVEGRGKVVMKQSFQPSEYANGVASKTFQINKPRRLVAIDLDCAFDNAWGYFDVSVRKDGKEYFTLSKEISYYHGYEGGESWSEGAQSVSAYFKVPTAGKYQLFIHGEGGTGNYGTKLQPQILTVTIREGVIVSRYFFIAAVGFGLLAAFGIWSRIKYETERRGIEFELSD